MALGRTTGGRSRGTRMDLSTHIGEWVHILPDDFAGWRHLEEASVRALADQECLEPISKSPEEDNEASELYEAEEVLGVYSQRTRMRRCH